MLIETIELGPRSKELKEQSDGRSYRIYATRGTNIYRIDIFGPLERERLHNEEREHESDDDAIEWGRHVFQVYLMTHGREVTIAETP